jgi:CSLREA domain-containing protein
MLSNPASKLVWRQRTTVLMVGLAVIVGLLMVGLLASGAQAAPSSFTVNSTADPGTGSCDATECTLREAIDAANANNNPTDQDLIIFDIPAESDPGCDSVSGVCTISPAGSFLPVITQRVTIDGYTQPGSQPNTLAVGNDAVLNIELDGTNAGFDGAGLILGQDASNCVIQGLVINNFNGDGINIASDNNKIEGNFLGTDPSGTQAEGNDIHGVGIFGSNNTIVGGNTPEARNLISGNGDHGVALATFTDGTKVMGNYIGTKRDGRTRLGNAGDGVFILDSSNNIIGGGTAQGANKIAFNESDGVAIEEDVFFANGNRIRINSIFSNDDLGIDLGDDGVTTNDAQDTDNGPNNLQNRPRLTSATTTPSHTTIEGILTSTPNENFTIRFFSTPAFAPFGYEGRTHLGAQSVTTDANGQAPFSKVLNKGDKAGDVITATATRSSTGDTSEFSGPRQVVQQ